MEKNKIIRDIKGRFVKGQISLRKLNLPEREVINLYNTLSSNAISKKFNCSNNVVLKLLKRNNIEIKRKSKYDRTILIKCACGCEGLRQKFDKKGREKRFIYGHQIRGDLNPTKRLDVRKKISKALIGRKLTIKHCNNISISNKGKIFGYKWKKGHKINNGKTLSIEHRKKISKGIKNNLPSTAFKKGHISHNKGKKGIYSEEIINKIKEARAKQILPFKDSKIEIKIQDFLTTLQIEFLTHKYMNIKNSYQCDIFIPVQIGIPQKIVIECDGDFFHMNPNKFSPEDKIFKKGMTAKERWKLDNSRTKQLIEKRFRVIRIWENEIKVMELNDFKERLNGRN